MNGNGRNRGRPTSAALFCRRKARALETIPGKGWFAYFRIYGPQGPAFDGIWLPGDFEKLG